MSLYLLFLSVILFNCYHHLFSLLCSVGSYNGRVCKGDDWKSVLIQWLTLLKLMKNPRSFRFSQFVNDVLQNRLARLLNSIFHCSFESFA